MNKIVIFLFTFLLSLSLSVSAEGETYREGELYRKALTYIKSDDCDNALPLLLKYREINLERLLAEFPEYSSLIDLQINLCMTRLNKGSFFPIIVRDIKAYEPPPDRLPSSIRLEVFTRPLSDFDLMKH